jgi:hypothetical protein
MRSLNLRSVYINRLREKLNREGYPRLQMALLVSITGVSGFIASYLLLQTGMSVMWTRYLAAFGVAYLIFLGLLWLWMRTSASDYADGPDFTPTSGWSAKADPIYCGKGGSFDGGGASGNFEIEGSSNFAQLDSSGDTLIGDSVSAACEADEFAIPIVAILFLAGLILSSLWVVYAAPLLFAELLIDGALAASLYRRLRGLESRHWLETAVRRTAAPFLLTAIMLVCFGAGLQHHAPDAQTMAQALFAGR